MEASCKCIYSHIFKGDYYLKDHAIISRAVVHFRNNITVTSAYQKWLRRAELDHGDDFNTWAQGAGLSDAKIVEKTQGSVRYSNEKDCVEGAINAMINKLIDSFKIASENSVITHDLSERHKYSSFKRRP